MWSTTESGTLAQPYTFTARERDPETGLYYYRARYYDPRIGRFITKDPIGLAGGDVNFYRYVRNSPVNEIDPLGLYWFRQSWQTPGVVGRRGTPVPPGGPISKFIEDYVPAGYTFGEIHDAFVENATGSGTPDWLVNIPTMLPLYRHALLVELLRSLGYLDQPMPQPAPIICK